MAEKIGDYPVYEVVLITGQCFPMLDLKRDKYGWLAGVNLKTNNEYWFNPEHVLNVLVFPDRESWAKAVAEAGRGLSKIH